MESQTLYLSKGSTLLYLRPHLNLPCQNCRVKSNVKRNCEVIVIIYAINDQFHIFYKIVLFQNQMYVFTLLVCKFLCYNLTIWRVLLIISGYCLVSVRVDNMFYLTCACCPDLRDYTTAILPLVLLKSTRYSCYLNHPSGILAGLYLSGWTKL